jgi:hypothetical protein
MRDNKVHLVKFSDLTTEQINEIAKIHKTVMSFSINAQAGTKHLIKLYTTLQASSLTIGFAAIDEGKIIGCALGTSHLGQMNSFLIRKKLVILVKCMNPIFLIANIKNIYDAWQISALARKFKLKGNYILVWFIDEQFSGLGYATEMLRRLELELLSINKSNIYVDVRKGSIRAFKTYNKLDYFEVARTRNSVLLTKST